MIALLKLLWSGCWHRWQTIRVVNLTVDHGDGDKSTGDRYILRCERCGDVTKRDLA